mgnify:CR=1 FL=1
MGALGDDLESLLRAVQYLANQDALEFYTVWNGGRNKIASKVNKDYLKRGNWIHIIMKPNIQEYFSYRYDGSNNLTFTIHHEFVQELK